MTVTNDCRKVLIQGLPFAPAKVSGAAKGKPGDETISPKNRDNKKPKKPGKTGGKKPGKTGTVTYYGWTVPVYPVYRPGLSLPLQRACRTQLRWVKQAGGWFSRDSPGQRLSACCSKHISGVRRRYELVSFGGILRTMATLLQSPPNPLSLAGVAEISRQLADDVGRLVLRTEGFSVEDYLSLAGPYLVEYVDGCLTVLPMPNALHQAVAFVLANLLIAYSKPDFAARTKLAPFRVRITEREFREPDVCFMRGIHADRRTNQFWIGADLVAEVISENNRDHDFQTKRKEYARAGIPEYWIVEPEENRINIFVLINGEYAVHGEFGLETVAPSATLDGFAVDVTQLFKDAEAQA